MKRLVFIFEFGLPPYRRFLIEALQRRYFSVDIYSGEDRFSGWIGSTEVRLRSIFSTGSFSFYGLNPISLFSANVVFSTFNLRRPHTWVWIFVMPWKRWVFWGHGIGANRSFGVNILRRLVLKISSAFIVYTEAGRAELIEFGYPVEKIIIAYNTLDIPNHGITHGGEYFLYVGRLQDRKLVDRFINMLASSRAKLRIVGDGSIRETLEALVLSLGLSDRVEFFDGTFDNCELKEHFLRAIAYVSPGHVGLGVVHAFAYGVPVVTLRYRDHAPEFEYCNNENSYLFDSDDDLQNFIRNWPSNISEHEEKRKRAYFTYSTQLTPDRMVNAFIQGIE